MRIFKKLKPRDVFFAALFVYAGYNCVKLSTQEVWLQKYHTRLETEMQQVAAEQADLQKQIDYYKTTQGVEELARNRLGYYKQDEVPVRVIAKQPTVVQQPPATLVTDPANAL
jgi:cell division protein FtsB